MSDHRDELLAAYKEIERLRKRINRISFLGLDLIAQLKDQNRSLPGEIDTFEEALTENEKHDA